MSQALTTFRAKNAAALTNPTSASVFVTSASASAPAVVYIPIISQSSVCIKVRARGRAHAGTSGNFTPAIQFGTSVTAGSNTAVATPTGTLTDANDCSWLIEATFVWDSTKQQLGGYYITLNGSTVNLSTNGINTTTTKTGVDLSVAGNGFVVTALFGTSNANNQAFLDELALEVA